MCPLREIQQTKSFLLSGGLNLITPALNTPPGNVIAGVNYEGAPRGYARVRGYERFSGKAKPSQASYWVLTFKTGTAGVVAGNVVTGATSGATGIALYNGILTSGSYGGSNARGTLVLTAVSGTFQDLENLQVSASTVAVADGVAQERGATNDTTDATYYRAAVAYARTQIAAVPGSGPVRGVWVFNNTTYAFRDNVGATAGVMHKATTAGWVAQNLGRTVGFTSGGTIEIVEGNTITGATSAATATVRRVILTSGTWAGGNAAGRLILSGQTGNFVAENLNVGASLNVATIAANSTAIALPAGGKYRFTNHNFFGASNLKRMYGVNGVGRGFEWDGTVFVPIITGMPTDTPTHVAVYKNHLFLAFPGGSLQNSATGDPYEWSAILGAAEIGIGEDITGLLESASTSMIVFGRNKVLYLTGDDAANFVLNPLSNESGAIEDTAQVIGNPMYMDDGGVRDMSTTNAFGDWKMGAVTQMIEPLVRRKREAGILPVNSMRVRARDHYRLFYSDGTGFSIYFGRKPAEILPFDLGKVVQCCCSGEDANGNEILFFGDNQGFVYQMEAGTSFDGAVIAAYLRLPFNPISSPQYNKRFHKAILEIDGNGQTTLGLTAEFSYADPDSPPAVEQMFAVRGSGGFWNESQWNSFYWSSPVEGLAESYLDGLGKNISLTVVSESQHEESHTVHGYTLNFSFRGMVR